MTIAVHLNESQKEEWIQKGSGTAQVHFLANLSALSYVRADVLIDLLYTPHTSYTTVPPLVFVNAVTTTCSSLPPGFIRLNAWPGFLQSRVTEVAVRNTEEQQAAVQALTVMGWEHCFTPDIPGFITTRVIASIINEAFYALEEEVSTRTEIDTAMKLGTNYPLGPFEWCSKIGAANIFDLLHLLSHHDNRYKPAPLLVKEAELTL